jgi:hypothetical protein
MRVSAGKQLPLLQWAGLGIGTAALTLQVFLTIPASLDAGRSVAGSILFYLSFFTVLTNMLAVLSHFANLGFGGTALSRFRTPLWRGGIAVAIAVVGIVYALVLAKTWQPQGLWLAADVLLHYVTPFIYVGWWLVAGRSGALRWSDTIRWLVWPVAYVVYALLRAPLAGEVPYPFLDYAALGWPHVAMALLAILALFVLIGNLAVAADKWLPRIETDRNIT